MHPTTEVFAGVERSVTGKRWTVRPAEVRLAAALAQRLGVPEIIGRVLAGRGVGIDEADMFVGPTLRRLLPDPSRIRDMDVGAARLAAAIAGGEQVAVFADYDVDGATSAALLSRFFAALGRPARLYVPDRLNEGYGPNADALMALKLDGIDVVVTVDCGSTAHDALRVAADAGLDVIVVDHHAVEGRLPPAAAVINPNRLDDDSGQGQLAAVGVTFMLIVAVNRCLRQAGFYRNGDEPDLLQWLDLVAVGTLCDMVPLTGVNRALVAQGLKVMAQWLNPGLKALARLGGLSKPPEPHHIGFMIGPRINAAGRVGEAGLSARLLASGDDAEAADLARRLDQANRLRREIEASVVEQAIDQIAVGAADTPVLMAAGDDWHPGVVGIVASRLVERFNRPACVVGLRNGCGTGSGRSVPGADLGAAVIAARHAGIVSRGGGHAMAAGFSVARGDVAALHAFLCERLAATLDSTSRVPTLELDGALAVAGATTALAATLAQVGPYGSGHPEPRFAVVQAVVANAVVLRGNNVRCVLKAEDGGRLEGVAFRAADTPLGRQLLRGDGAPLHVAGRLRANGYNGRSKAEFHIDDIACVFA